MQQHRRTPEQALLAKEYEEINRLAWKFRRATGGQLRLAMISFVPENLRYDVLERIKFIQRKHKIGVEH